MDAVRIFTCHFFGQGEQLTGTHSWQRAGRVSRQRAAWQAACLGEELEEAQRCGWMDGWTGAGIYAPSQRSFVAVPASCKNRHES